MFLGILLCKESVVMEILGMAGSHNFRGLSGAMTNRCGREVTS